jgi:hypothetical protein
MAVAVAQSHAFRNSAAVSVMDNMPPKGWAKSRRLAERHESALHVLPQLAEPEQIKKDLLR